MSPPQMQFFFDPPKSALQKLRNRLWLRSQMRKVDHFVWRHGLAVVPFQLPQDLAPRYSYSVGFDETFGHPELIVFDQPWETASAEFFHVRERLFRNQLELEDGMVWIESEDGRCVWRKVHPSQAASGWMGLARERRRQRTGDDAGLQAFQLVATDKAGVLPWEAGYDEAARRWQPALWEAVESSERLV